MRERVENGLNLSQISLSLAITSTSFSLELFSNWKTMLRFFWNENSMFATAIWAIFNRFGHIFTLDPRFDWGRPPLLLSVNHQHGAKFRSVNMRVLLLIRSLDASFVTCERRMRLQSGMSDLRSILGQFREKVRWFLWGQLHPKPKLRSDYGFEQKTLPDFSHSVKSRNIRERAKECTYE